MIDVLLLETAVLLRKVVERVLRLGGQVAFKLDEPVEGRASRHLEVSEEVVPHSRRLEVEFAQFARSRRES